MGDALSIGTHPTAIATFRRRAVAAVREHLAPPPRLSVSEWADRFRYLSREASAEAGKWRTDRAPYLREIMDVCSTLGVERVVVMKGAQMGLTELLGNLVGYFMVQDPAPMMVLHPTDRMGEAWSKDRLAPMLRDTPALRGRVRDVKSRDSGNTLLHKQFTGGHITISGANAPASLASRPIRVVLCDEVDRYPASAGTEGDPVSLTFKRTAAFWNRLLVMVSTPTLQGYSRIEAAYDESDRRTFHVPCPHCTAMQPLEWKRDDGNPGITWDKTDDGEHLPATARYVCTACGALIDESAKPAMLQAGVWVAERPGAAIAGFHLNALYSPWLRWAEIVEEFLAVRKHPERLKVWVNTVLGEPWEERQEGAADGLRLATRREAYPAEVPAGGAVLTAGVDVQADRLEVAVKAWGPGEESWLVLHERLFGDPTREDVWQRLEVQLARTYGHASRARLRIRACAIDSGAFTDAVYAFVRTRQERGVYAVKGRSDRGRAIVENPGRANKEGVRVFPIGVDTAKDVLFARLQIVEPGPGYLHFPQEQPAGVDVEYFKQFAAEKVVTRIRAGQPVREYRQIRKRNEAIDLEVLNLAALRILGPSVHDQLDQWLALVREAGARGGEVQLPRIRRRRRGMRHPGLTREP